MLQRVTAGFYDDAYIAQWMFEAIGREYDEMFDWAQGLRYEINPQTCTWSIAIWEWVYGFEPDDSLPLELRRQRLLAKIISGAPLNPEVIRRGIAALTGIDLANITVTENVAPYTFRIEFNQVDEVLDQFDVWRYVHRIKPSHLSFEMISYVYRTTDYTTYFNAAAYEYTEMTIRPVSPSRTFTRSTHINTAAYEYTEMTINPV